MITLIKDSFEYYVEQLITKIDFKRRRNKRWTIWCVGQLLNLYGPPIFNPQRQMQNSKVFPLSLSTPQLLVQFKDNQNTENTLFVWDEDHENLVTNFLKN